LGILTIRATYMYQIVDFYWRRWFYEWLRKKTFVSCVMFFLILDLFFKTYNKVYCIISLAENHLRSSVPCLQTSIYRSLWVRVPSSQTSCYRLPLWVRQSGQLQSLPISHYRSTIAGAKFTISHYRSLLKTKMEKKFCCHVFVILRIIK